MRYTIDVHSGYIKAEMRERESGDETRPFVEAILAALLGRQRGLDCKTFGDEQVAVAWLLEDAASPRDGGE